MTLWNLAAVADVLRTLGRFSDVHPLNHFQAMSSDRNVTMYFNIFLTAQNVTASSCQNITCIMDSLRRNRSVNSMPETFFFFYWEMNYLLPATGNKIHFKSRFFHTCVRPPVTKWPQAGQSQWKRRPRILHVHKVWRLVVKTYMVSWTGHVANSSLNSRPGTAMFFFTE